MQTVDQYNQAVESCKTVFINKARDYGTSWRVYRLISVVDQIYIKAKRIRTIQEKQVQKIEEDFETFWNSASALRAQNLPKSFSTFTLGKPCTLWSYYFSDESEKKLLLENYSPISLKIPSFDQTHLQARDSGLRAAKYRGDSRPPRQRE